MSKTLVLLAVLGFAAPAPAVAADRLNVLIITVDDMNADSLGVFGCKLADTSPNIDRLASEGMRFNYAHVQVANCMPSRNVLLSGLYPHNNRVEGFYKVRNPDYPVMADLMKAAGYFTAIRGKVGHSTPYTPYDWDLVLDRLPNGEPAERKDIASYKTSTEQGIRAAKAAGKPFCLSINVSDPHKPFYGEGRRGLAVRDPHVPSRVFTPEEVSIPGFLFDDPVVRQELANYYSSVRRADDCVGGVLEALEESGEDDRTVVIFLSDHGMPLPFAKTQLYHHSTHTPLAVRWPGVTKAGTRDDRHMVSAVDFLPTLLDIVGAPLPKRLDGRSFEPLLRGESQEDRDMVFKEYNENSGGSRAPMRAVQTRRLLYIFNPWSDGERVMGTATRGTATYRRMTELARPNPAIAQRLDLFEHRVVEELYDVEKDPDCLRNLIDDAAYSQELARLRKALEAWMVKTADPMLEVFRKRDDASARAAYMASVEEAAEERGPRRRGRANRQRPRQRPRRNNVGRNEVSRPNIVFILADDLGYSDVGCYGSKYYETPNIDRLAAEGVRFTDGYTCGPNCQPTRAALLSGQYGPRTGVYTVGSIDRFNWRSRPLRPVDNVTTLPVDRITIAQTLKTAGYATAMFGKWHLGKGASHHPQQRGFDEAIEASGRHFDFRTDPRVEYDDGAYLADFLTDRAIDFIERHRARPFFLYLPHFAVHAPHQAKEELVERFEAKEPVGGHRDPTYAAMIASLDESVGRVVAKLDELGLAASTLVIFSSDNGGVGGYRSAGLAKDGITNNAPLKGGKGMLAEGGIRVPYIFRWPGRIEAGRTEATPINSVDLYPTLIELARAQAPADYQLDGTSYARLLTGESQSLDRDAIYWHFPGYLGAGAGKWRTTPCGAVRSGGWKLLEYFEDGRLELYNLKEDIGEQKNLATEQPDKTKELHGKLVAWRKSVQAAMPTENTDVRDNSNRERRRRNRQRNRAAARAPM